MDWRAALSRLGEQAGGFHAEKVTVGAAGSVTVAATAVLVSAVRAAGGLTGSVRVLDGATEVWAVGVGNTDTFDPPLRLDTSLVLDFPGAGDAWVIFG